LATLSYGIAGSATIDINPFAQGGPNIVEVASGNWYLFFPCSNGAGSIDNLLIWIKSTDRGRTWGVQNAISASNGRTVAGIWYDRWTPGDTGNLIHIAWMDTTNDDILYANLNVSSDTLSGITTVFAGASFLAGASVSTQVNIHKTRGGTAAIVFDGDSGTETGHYVAVSPFTSWTSKSNPNEAATSDWYFGLPGNYADADDYDLYFLDRSADGWSRKTYDASGDSWSEATLVADGGVFDNGTIFRQLAGCVRLSDSMHFVFAWHAYDAATSDLLGFKWDGTTLTALTNVVTDADDCAGVAPMYDEAADRLYVFYLGKSDGSQTATATLGVYYKYSDDDGSTWSAEQTLFNTYLDDFRFVGAPLNVASVSVAPPVTWFNDDTKDVMTTAENPSGASGGGSPIIGSPIVRAA